MDAQIAAAQNSLHEELLSCARLRAQLDRDELTAIRRGLEVQIWKSTGCASMNEYLRRYLGYGPVEARDRIRAARMLADCPEVERSLGDGRIAWSHVRTLTGLVEPATAAAWVLAAEHRPAPAFREFAKGAGRGDHPGDDRHPSLRPTEVVLELLPEQLAMVDEATVLMRKTDPNLSREQVVAHGCRLILGLGGDGKGERDAGLSSYQISYSICPQCGKATTISGGVEVPVGAGVAEMAHCDKTDIGNVDGELPERASQDPAPALRRLIVARDHGRCRFPGCRARLFLDVHHLLARSEGGGNEPSNLALLCWTHHTMIHAGWIVARGDASTGLTFFRSDGRAVEDPSVVPEEVARGYRAFQELVRRGVTERDATKALLDAQGLIEWPSGISFEDGVRLLVEAAMRTLNRTGPDSAT